MSVIGRFFETIEKAGITPYQIEKKMGVKSAQSKLSQLKEKETKGGKEKTISSDILSAVCTNCDIINIEYILTGRGDPLLNKQEKHDISNSFTEKSTIMREISMSNISDALTSEISEIKQLEEDDLSNIIQVNTVKMEELIKEVKELKRLIYKSLDEKNAAEKAG